MNKIQFKNIRVVLPSFVNNEIKLRICSKYDEKISNFQTNNIASYDINVYLFYMF